MESQGIFWCDGNWPGRVAIIARPRGGDWLKLDLESYRREGVDVIVSLLHDREADELGLRDEGAAAKALDLDFISFPIEDYGIPSSTFATITLVEELLQKLENGKGVGIHCRQSLGRASVVAACLLVRSGQNPQLIFDSLQRIRGVPVPDTFEQKRFLESFANSLAVTSR